MSLNLRITMNVCVCVCVYSQRFPCSRCGLVSPSSLCVRCGVATIAFIAYCCYYCCFCSFALFHCSHFERIIRSICASDLNCKLFTPAARSFEIVQCFPKQMNIWIIQIVYILRTFNRTHSQTHTPCSTDFPFLQFLRYFFSFNSRNIKMCSAFHIHSFIHLSPSPLTKMSCRRKIRKICSNKFQFSVFCEHAVKIW